MGVFFCIALDGAAEQPPFSDCEAQQDGKRCAFLRARWAEGCSIYRMGDEGRAKALQLSALIADDLQASDARAILIGRAGSDASRERFTRRVGEARQWWDYTHGGFAFRSSVDDDWVVIHLLNVCKESSGIFRETLEEFFLDNPWEYRAIVAIPTAEVQDALLELMLRRDLSDAFFDNSIYSSISYPYSLERQNSTEYALDVLVSALAYAAGVADVYDRENAKAYFLSSHAESFQPEAIESGVIERFGVSLGLGPKNVTFRDHPAESKRSGIYEFVSIGALIQFLDTVGALQEARKYALPVVQKASDTVEVKP